MKIIPNKMVDDLIRYLPILIENIDTSPQNTKVCDTIRLSKIIVKQLKRIQDDEKRSDH